MSEMLDGQSCALRSPAPLPEDPVPAMAYVPFQQYRATYQPEQALDNGTLFPDLNKPFSGGKEPRS